MTKEKIAITRKVVLVGDDSCGKSSILHRFAHGTFRNDVLPTCGVDWRIAQMRLADGTFVKLQIWDTNGTDRYKDITSRYYTGAHAFVLAFDITRRNTFERLNGWFELIQRCGDSGTPVYLIGNKVDMASQREVDTSEILKLAAKDARIRLLEDHLFLTSAKTGQGVQPLFEHLTLTMMCEGTSLALVSEVGVGSFRVSSFALQAKARAAAAKLWCCWVLFLVTPEGLCELDTGGVGFATPSIRTYAKTHVQTSLRSSARHGRIRWLWLLVQRAILLRTIVHYWLKMTVGVPKDRAAHRTEFARHIRGALPLPLPLDEPAMEPAPTGYTDD